MLGHTYRYSVNNQSGVSLTSVVIKSRDWKFGTDGSLTYAAEATDFSVSTIANSTTAWSNGATQSNTALNLGADLLITITPSASATGTVSVQIQRSTDGGTTWPTDGQGEFVGAYTFAASSTAVVVGAVVGA